MNSTVTFLCRRFSSIGTIVLFSLFLRLLIYQPYSPTWDASVYILIGKYIFSSGEVGLIEPFRPLLWPGILGFLWKLGWDPIWAGRVLSISLTLGNIYLIYKIGKKVFSETTAVLGAWLLSLSPVYFYWGQSIFADIPGSILGLLMVCLYLEGFYFVSGITGALAVQTKFAQILTVMILFAAHVLRAFSEKRIIPLLKTGAGFILFSTPFFIIFALLYGDMLAIFSHAQDQYTKISYSWHLEILYALKQLAETEGIFLLFVPMSLAPIKRKNNSSGLWLIFILALALSLWVGKLPTEVLRFSIPALPYLYILSAEGIKNTYERLRRCQKKAAVLFLIVVSLMMIYQIFRLVTIRFPSSRLNTFQNYVIKNEALLKGKNIWISNPKTLVYSNLQASEIMYYPKMGELLPKVSEADFIFFDSRDVPCVSRYDETCEEDKRMLVQKFKKEFEKDFYFEIPDQEIVVGIFHK